MRILPIATLGLALFALAAPAGAGGYVQRTYRLADFHHPLTIDNRYWPLTPGRHVVFYEVDGEDCEVNDFVVTSDTKSFGGRYAGLIGRVVRDRSYIDRDCDGGRDALHEDTYDWYAQDDYGDIWYLGENTIEYLFDDAGHRIGSTREGSWEAGRGGALAGLQMLAHPQAGQFYREEYLEGVAEDWGKVIATGATVTTGLGTFRGCVVIKEWTPLENGAIEQKSYCPTAGLVLVESKGGGAEAVDLGLP